MKIEVSVAIDRPPDVVWPVLVDVERWPEWTASVTAIERLDSPALGVGSSVRIRQPRLKSMVWHVTDYQDGEFFTWKAQSPGLTVVGRHAIRSAPGGSIVTLTVEQTGLLSPLVALLLGRLSRRYVDLEAQGLKRRCEGVSES